MRRLAPILAVAVFLLPASAGAQPRSLTPNELHWFTHGMLPEPRDKEGLAELLKRDAKSDATHPWLSQLLVVGWPGFGDADMKDVARMKKLTNLWIRKSLQPEKRGAFKVTAAGWRELRELPNLRVLGVSDVELDDDAFAEIGKLTGLIAIYLDCKGSNAGVKELMNLKKLVHASINVQGAKPGDDIAKDLANLTELRDLGIAHAAISDKGVKEFVRLPSLRSLGISSADITDAGLKEVANMKAMVAVNLASTKVTEDGIEDLWKARPDLLMVNGAGMPPGPDSLWTMQVDFYNAGAGMHAADSAKKLAEITDTHSSLRRLGIGWPGLSSADMKDVVAFKRLTHLHVAHATRYGPDDQKLEVKIDARGWKRLAELPRLRVLIVSQVQIDVESLAEIGKLPELRTLRLVNVRAGDAGVRQLANLKKLTGLDLMGSQITDAGLKDFGQYKNLHYLSLGDNRLTDDGLKHLAELPQLPYLYLDANKITDAGLKHLANIKGLHFVSLLGTQISDEGLKILAEIKTLKAVNLPMDKVTPMGIAWFAKARPDIQYLPPPAPIELHLDGWR